MVTGNIYVHLIKNGSEKKDLLSQKTLVNTIDTSHSSYTKVSRNVIHFHPARPGV
jgi:hypothetical protein